MSAPAFFRKELGVLRPSGAAAEELLRAVKHGETVRVDVKKPRNVKQHRLFWALCQIVADNMDGPYTAELVAEVIKINVGHVTPFRTVKGKLFYVPKSISFAKMTQAEFNIFFESALQVVVREIIPGLDSDALREEVNAIIGG